MKMAFYYPIVPEDGKDVIQYTGDPAVVATKRDFVDTAGVIVNEARIIIALLNRQTFSKDKAKAVGNVGALKILVCPECFAFRQGNRR